MGDKKNDVSWLHRSDNWGGKPHVDIGDSHGHSPTINPPPRDENGAIKIGKLKDLPPPFGKVD